MSDMARNGIFKARDKRGGVRLVLTLTGAFLIVISPLVGAIPGPGGIFVFAAGLALMLKNSIWAKKLYARLKRRYPKRGEWVDWSLRRRSALRRARKSKAGRRDD
ncbi:MAG: hypothetical protein RLN87_01345 [Parasphingopyxis sp.]|uniref:hypothetical protein n=1 Tax=Parasphingopyxis sp. TaxID=1920299 RepID=UPI00261DE06A|nr:hypothetical protein [uncultured Parasphingopyxis sp.]